MNKRPFLFGVGIGIIIGASLLQLMLIGERQVGESSNVDQETAVLKTYTEAEVGQRLTEERDRIRIELQQEFDNRQKVKEKPAEAVKENAADLTDRIRSEIVRIPPNASLIKTASILEAAEIISDKKSFLDLMRGVKVRAGYFLFVGQPTLQQVKNVITGTPLPMKNLEAELARLKRD
ncbi:hypothetical protein KZ483_17885 [Paenibacillus sp. sptzw28]|uniref:hypothetical protein n=1 Tax=Paenibacillus sp. sptzw28 TaxID=715179 RepID=UPI001C6E0B42|nr:hypothetical protein [Paenibacillus sp. sptzw28]QYR19745.1 hypothetical protein KZ483_17885 [Paenibacillus sp. sptzw28]